MELGNWPIAVVLWAAGALVVFFTRQGISRDARVSAVLAVLFFLLGAAVLVGNAILLAFVICLPLGAGMVWAGVLPLLDALNYNIKVDNAIYRGCTPEIEARKASKQLLTFSYTVEGGRLTGTSVDAFTPGQIERDFTVGKPAAIWVNRNNLSSCKVHRYENIVLAPLAIATGLVFLAIPFIRLFG